MNGIAISTGIYALVSLFFFVIRNLKDNRENITEESDYSLLLSSMSVFKCQRI